MPTPQVIGRRRLPLVLIGYGLMRIGSGAGGVLVGLYLADVANKGSTIDALLVGTLGAVSFIGDEALRGKAMSFFELSLLAGLALGGLLGSTSGRRSAPMLLRP